MDLSFSFDKLPADLDFSDIEEGVFLVSHPQEKNMGSFSYLKDVGFLVHLLNFQDPTFQAAGFAGSFRIAPFESFYPKGWGRWFNPKPLGVEVVNVFVCHIFLVFP